MNPPPIVLTYTPHILIPKHGVSYFYLNISYVDAYLLKLEAHQFLPWPELILLSLICPQMHIESILLKILGKNMSF